MESKTAHYIILALAAVIVVLAALSLAKKKEGYTPVAYRSKMSGPQMAQTMMKPSCLPSVINYCNVANKNQRILGDVSLEGVGQDVYVNCGAQFPTEEVCATMNPMFKLAPSDFYLGGTHTNLL